MKVNALQMALMWFLLTTFYTAVNALALVDLELKSSLNQPLDVRIGLMTSAVEELDGLVVKVTGINPGGGGYLTVPHLQHELIRSETGNYLRITSRDAIREPVLSFLVEIIWDEGHFLREYSLLIDPKELGY
jgi:pilus assembly protein FimV